MNVSGYKRGSTSSRTDRGYFARRPVPYLSILGFIVFFCLLLMVSGFGLRVVRQPPGAMVAMLLGFAIGCGIWFLSFRVGVIIGLDAVVTSHARATGRIILLFPLLYIFIVMAGLWIIYSKQAWPNGEIEGKLASFVVLNIIHCIDCYIIGYIIGLSWVLIKSITKRPLNSASGGAGSERSAM